MSRGMMAAFCHEVARVPGGKAMGCGLRMETHRQRAKVLDAMLVLVSLMSIATIGLLHEHACTGDGCLLCLLAGGAQVLLALCVCLVATRPILRLLAGATCCFGLGLPVLDPSVGELAGACVLRGAQTPVTLKDRLLI